MAEVWGRFGEVWRRCRGSRKARMQPDTSRGVGVGVGAELGVGVGVGLGVGVGVGVRG